MDPGSGLACSWSISHQIIPDYFTVAQGDIVAVLASLLSAV